MYIFELFVKWLNKNKRGTGANPEGIYSEEDVQNNELEDEICEHKFMPIDSTGEILACTKCGFVVKRNDKNEQ